MRTRIKGLQPHLNIHKIQMHVRNDIHNLRRNHHPNINPEPLQLLLRRNIIILEREDLLDNKTRKIIKEAETKPAEKLQEIVPLEGAEDQF